MDRREWLWLAAFIAGILLLTSLPYWSAARAQTPSLIFNGAVFDRQDYAVHLAAMHLGARGEWAYRLRFTAETHEGAYVKQFYLALGHAARLARLSLPAAYQLARWAFGAAALAAVYLLGARAFPSLFARRLFFALAALASGFGWLQLITGWLPDPSISPIDFWLVDAYPFFGILAFPHFAASIACLAGMPALFLSALRRPRGTKTAALILLGVFLAWTQPFAPALADLAMGGALLADAFAPRSRGGGRSWVNAIPWGGARLLGAAVLAQLPFVWYNFTIFRDDPLMQTFALQNATLSPPPVYYAAGFGVLGALALFGIPRQPEPARWSALAWLAGALALAYLPWNLQRRFVLALTIPLATLAVDGLRLIWRRVSAADWIQARRGLWATLLVLFASFSSLYLAAGTAFLMQARPPGFFDPAPLVNAVDQLARLARPDDVVLAESIEASQLIAARGGLVAFWGHPIETLDFDQKRLLAAQFYAGGLGEDWLRAAVVDWVIVEGEVLSLSLALVYEADGVQVYRVAP